MVLSIQLLNSPIDQLHFDTEMFETVGHACLKFLMGLVNLDECIVIGAPVSQHMLQFVDGHFWMFVLFEFVA